MAAILVVGAIAHQTRERLADRLLLTHRLLHRLAPRQVDGHLAAVMESGVRVRYPTLSRGSIIAVITPPFEIVIASIKRLGSLDR